MKKGSFEIKERTENRGWKMEKVEGFYSENFGIHKLDDDRCSSWNVTHLKTGLKLCSFDYLREARFYIEKLEGIRDWPVAWDSSTNGEDYRPNGNMALRLRDEVKYALR
jgi:hypothetical protein